MEPTSVSEGFVRISSALLTWSMPPLALGLSSDVYIVSTMVTRETAVSAVLATFALAIFGGLWSVAPWRARLE
jgi:hypothetical protein